MAFGLLGVGYGIYDIYSSMTTWATELTQDLRIAVGARQRGDYKSSVEAFRKHMEKLLLCPHSAGIELIKHPLYLSRSRTCSRQGTGDLKPAYDVYITALNDLKLNGSLVEESGA
ncbi:hypothetical protein FRC03_009909 [Tulasnella sp. 419]|nr:hypothetical protein FRC02_009942 [Tulasnella sp. 418]KAG8957689.1 hypothetical protein FRC03_009909 [Tulasnella sp. 419]